MFSKPIIIGIACVILVVAVIGNVIASVSSISYKASLLWSELRDVVVSGQYAYISYAYGLEIYDLSDPTQQVLVSQLAIPGTGRNLAIDGNTVPEQQRRVARAVYALRFARHVIAVG